MSDEEIEDRSLRRSELEHKRAYLVSELASDRAWRRVATVAALLATLVAFRACESADYRECVDTHVTGISGPGQMRTAAECRAAGWP